MTSSANTKHLNALFSINIKSGSIEALKWIAVASMTIDHFNRFFFNGSVEGAYDVGRLAMPIFAFIFAYNLSRPGTLERQAYYKSFKRLIAFGILATPAYMAMRHLQHLWPLNIMFMLFAAAFFFYCCEMGGILYLFLGSLVAFVAGIFVEYSWIGILFCIAAWFFCKNSTPLSLAAFLVSYGLLDYLNGNHWALVSLPLIFLATQIDFKIARIPYFFYVYYPTHLTIFWLATKIMR
ncbi:TraX family protein [Legionella jordanis]|uniref:TraX protein n=1 Tax=Legionella jordanis TaxID=456 RepID=A0A0W0VG23_9GAMM|nr:TraX family protein [Legionella jordanis]KTD19034.1 TraX protein [Legionella jordanis]RMX05407.1 conjugal transfer protein TraX [Legionella jordanis]RMX19090.1 conjugal transfer protein TraX [Legionella jordanis]VEH13137.1 conjugal transfer protein TrbP [Legionella jordanis]HAT8714796.1 conjugal transfer protein TraX [Legionella jordanis]